MKPSNIPFHDFQNFRNRAFFIRPILSNISMDEYAHRHNYQEILWIEGGIGQHSIDDKTLIIKANTIYLIGEGQVHQFIKGVALKGYLIQFLDSFLPTKNLNAPTTFCTAFIRRETTNELQMSEEQAAAIQLFFKQIDQEYHLKNAYGQQQIIQQLLLALLLKLEQFSKVISQKQLPNPTNPNQQIYQEFIALIEKHFYENHQITFYSQSLGLTRRRLSDLTKTIAGKTAKKVLIERIMTEAKRLLSYTNCSLKEITYRLGYEDPAYFCRIFKKEIQMTPQDYRKTNTKIIYTKK